MATFTELYAHLLPGNSTKEQNEAASELAVVNSGIAKRVEKHGAEIVLIQSTFGVYTKATDEKIATLNTNITTCANDIRLLKSQFDESKTWTPGQVADRVATVITLGSTALALAAAFTAATNRNTNNRLGGNNQGGNTTP